MCSRSLGELPQRWPTERLRRAQTEPQGGQRKCPKGLPGAELLLVPWEESLGEPSQKLGLEDG